MMVDQLHAFPDEATALTLFPRPEGAELSPCWLHGEATVMPVQVMMAGPDGPVAHPNFWLGVSLPEGSTALDVLWAIPTAQVELSRAEGEPANWLTRVRRSRLRAEAAALVVGVTPIFAGSSYTFGG